MAYIDEVLNFLGEPYKIITIDDEPVIFRKFSKYEFEVSGLYNRSKPCSIYVHWVTDHREIVGVYHGIHGKENLKDLLGYVAARYQNLPSQIQVEREERIV